MLAQLLIAASHAIDVRALLKPLLAGRSIQPLEALLRT
jgi:hypothetical protein